MGARETIDTLLQGIQHQNPRLYDILRMLSSKIELVNNSLIDTINSLGSDAITNPFSLSPPISFTYSLPGTILRLDWGNVNGASYYEIRKGTDWNTATFLLRTSSLTGNLNPILSGSHTYLIKSIDTNGEYSGNSTRLDLIIPGITEVSITNTIIDNTVLLYWTVPTTAPFSVSYYEVTKDGSVMGTTNGTFTTIFETASGSYTYGVTAYDSIGNYSPTTSITIGVDQPPDYNLLLKLFSTFTGTITNGQVVSDRLLIPVRAETYEHHFIHNSWNTIQDQLDASYPLYIQPSETTGVYEEVFDFGAVIDRVIINVLWSVELIPGDAVNTVCQIKYSVDGTTWTAYATGPSQFLTSARYANVRLTFTPVSDKALAYVSNLRCSLDIKYGTDSGDILVDASDVLGTFVAFNKDFLDINSITVSCADVNPVYVVYDFTDVPNPTGFYAYAFNAAGARIDELISWKARGII